MALDPFGFWNWSKTVHFRADRYLRPESEAEVQDIVRAAARDGKVVRTKGAGHSFSQIISTNDVLLSLDGLSGIVSRNGHSVTVHAGTRLKDLIPALKSQGLALKNIGSVTEQSIAGAVLTGTHGTGVGLGAMATGVTGMRIVDGRGDVEVIDGLDPTLLGAARVSLGTLGVVTQMTLDCVDYYDVDYNVYVCDLARALDDVDTLTQENQRVLIWWPSLPLIPRDMALVVTKNDAPASPTGILAQADDLGDALRRPRRWFWPFKRRYSGPLPADALEIGKALLPVLFKRGSGYTRVLHRSGGYEDMLTLPLLPVFHRECEYAIPLEHTKPAIEQLKLLLDEGDEHLTLPTEVRFVRGDQDLISPANKGDVAYIGVGTLVNATEVFERFEPLMRELGGRPHWGKHFNLTRSDVEAMYPRHGDFVAARRQRDPQGVFLNTLLRRLFA